jgi:hypothetical protein
MRQFTLITALLLTTSVFAANKKAKQEPKDNEITKIYEDFQKQKEELFKADINKKNIREQFDRTYKSLSTSYEQMKALETKNKLAFEFSKEGNQMAFDIETLEPIKELANGSMTEEDCSKARHEHELNFPIVKDEQSKSIAKLIKKVCTK